MEPGAGAWKRFFEHAGGEKAIRRFIEVFYASVLSDPVLQPLFDKGQPTHVEHLTAFDVEKRLEVLIDLPANWMASTTSSRCIKT